MANVANSLLDFIVTQMDADITHIGIGTGTAPAPGDTLLASEAQRKAATKLIDGTTLIKEGFWDTNEANGVTYTNAAVFGDGATDTLGTGKYRAGGAINIPKDNTQSLTVSIEITVEAVN
jgi:hypothetical protein